MVKPLTEGKTLGQMCPKKSNGSKRPICRPPAPRGNDTVQCKFCGADVLQAEAHRHQGEWVGDDCCWDERLRTTE
jgi:hypothetical protein